MNANQELSYAELRADIHEDIQDAKEDVRLKVRREWETRVETAHTAAYEETKSFASPSTARNALTVRNNVQGWEARLDRDSTTAELVKIMTLRETESQIWTQTYDVNKRSVPKRLLGRSCKDFVKGFHVSVGISYTSIDDFEVEAYRWALKD